MQSISPRRFLWILAIIKFIVPLVLYNSYYQLHRDEYLYLAEGNHLAWGFLEVPPMLPFLAWITNRLGGSDWLVKLWPNLAGVCILLMVGDIIIKLGGKKFAVLLGTIPVIIGGLLRMFYLFHPNFLDVLFWTLMAYGLFNYIQSKKNGWLYVFGLAVGCGMMSKYSSAFYAASLLVGLAISRHRQVYLNKHLYFAGILALVIFLPNILWQYNHNFPLVFHMQELQEEQLQYIQPHQFFMEQVRMNLPFLFIWVGALLFVILSKQGRNYRVFGWAYAIVITLLFIFHGKDYYAAGAYLILFALGGFWLEKLTAKSFYWLRFVMIAIPVLLCAFIMPLIMPVAKPATLAKYYKATGLAKSGALHWEDQQDHELPQDFADMIGWREMTQKVADVYNGLPASEKSKTMVYARAYYTAGALNHYGPIMGLPTVYSDNASFLFWLPKYYNISNLILVGHTMPTKDDVVFQQFTQVSVMDSVAMPMFRENGMKIILFRHGNDSVNALIEKSIAEQQQRYQR